ncbi:hypothetical protein [Flavobacterium sp. C4GT6]|uniref:hypothetical protein n=1 Tax=Flavobacterium sp. C4GT6 TaxID=3103818 RepID=UPI002ED44381
MIPEQFTSTREQYERYKDFIMLYHEDKLQEIYDLGLETTLRDPKTGLYWDDLLNDSFSQEYLRLTESSSYFEGCQHSIYIKTYKERLNEYIKLHPDADESHFIKSEYDAANSIREFHYGTKEQLTNLFIATEKRKKFLSERLTTTGHTPELSNSETKNSENANPEQTPTVFGNYNYQLIYNIYEELRDLLPPNLNKQNFTNIFLLTEKPTHKIDFIGANISTFAYLINNLHQYFTTELRNKTIYNQWWADRFTFNGSSRDKKGISTICSAVRKGDKTPDRRETINKVIALLT